MIDFLEENCILKSELFNIKSGPVFIIAEHEKFRSD